MKQDKFVYSGWMKIKKKYIKNKIYEILIKKNSFAALIKDNENKFLLVKQFRPALLKNTLEIPAGIMDKKHLTKKEAMLEELLEEANIFLEKKELKPILKIFTEIGISKSNIQLFYGKINKKGENIYIKNDPDVFATYWFSEKIIFEMILKGKIIDAKTILAFFAYKAFLKTN